MRMLISRTVQPMSSMARRTVLGVLLAASLVSMAAASTAYGSTVTVTSRPFAISQAGDSLDVFARGSDGALWHKYYRPYGWGPWESLGGSVASHSSGVSFANGHLD